MRVSDAARLLKKAGYDIPEEFQKYVEKIELENKGIVEVWTCRYDPDWRYESPIKLTGITCPRGHQGTKSRTVN